MAIKPFGNRILIEPIKNELQVSDSGILLGEERAPQSIKAKVVATGSDCVLTAVGDTVLVSQFSPTEAREKMSDQTLVCSEDDVLGVVVPDKPTK